MAGTIEGGLKAKNRNIERYGKDFYFKIGSKGGKACVSSKGFGSNPERAKLAGMKGGKISRRGPARIKEIEND